MVRNPVSRPIDVLHLGRDRVICAFGRLSVASAKTVITSPGFAPISDGAMCTASVESRCGGSAGASTTFGSA